MAPLGGADEHVVGELQRTPHLFEAGGHGVGVGQRLHPLLAGGALHVEAVLVGAHEEVDVVPDEPVIAGQRVGGDLLVGRPPRWGFELT